MSIASHRLISIWIMWHNRPANTDPQLSTAAMPQVLHPVA